MTNTFSADISYYQHVVNDSYPYKWLIFRACDGTFRDPNFSANYAWAQRAAESGRIAGYTVYAVYRPGVDIVSVVKSLVGNPDRHVTVMLDIESWGGQIGGNHSTEINRLANAFAGWLGNNKRVLAYGNQGDLASMYPQYPSWMRFVVAGYSSRQPSHPNMIGWQYSDGQAKWSVPDGYPRSVAPFGPVDHNVFPNLTPQQLATELGVAQQDWFDMATEADLKAAVKEALIELLKDKDVKALFHAASFNGWNNDAHGIPRSFLGGLGHIYGGDFHPFYDQPKGDAPKK